MAPASQLTAGPRGCRTHDGAVAPPEGCPGTRWLQSVPMGPWLCFLARPEEPWGCDTACAHGKEARGNAGQGRASGRGPPGPPGPADRPLSTVSLCPKSEILQQGLSPPSRWALRAPWDPCNDSVSEPVTSGAQRMGKCPPPEERWARRAGTSILEASAPALPPPQARRHSQTPLQLTGPWTRLREAGANSGSTRRGRAGAPGHPVARAWLPQMVQQALSQSLLSFCHHASRP